MFLSFFHKHAGSKLSAGRNLTGRKFLRYAIIAAVLVCTMMSCSQPTTASSGNSLVGTWSSASGDSYTITATSLTYNDGGYGYGWAGTIADISATDDTSGYIYVQYTSVGTKLSSTLVGTYYAIAYNSLGTSSVKLANAYKADGASSKSTLAEAKSEFTIANGYYASSYGSYSK